MEDVVGGGPAGGVTAGEVQHEPRHPHPALKRRELAAPANTITEKAPYDFCVCFLISRLFTLFRHAKCLNRFLNVKPLIGTFNKEKALVGAFSVIVQITD